MKKNILVLLGFLHVGVHAKLINIASINSHILIECRYATHNNFTGVKICECAENECYLQEEVARDLALVQNELEQLGYGLKVWDGY